MNHQSFPTKLCQCGNKSVAHSSTSRGYRVQHPASGSGR